MIARICVDSCFLIGLYDRDDQYHRIAVRQFEQLFGEKSERNQIVLPWPILYECLGTRFARDPRSSVLFNQRWKSLYESSQLWLLDDTELRQKCLSDHLGPQSRPLSLVDRVLRAMIEDRQRNFDYFLTHNTGDFMDACEQAAVILLNEHTSRESYGI
jgi:hypothetical protein